MENWRDLDSRSLTLPESRDPVGALGTVCGCDVERHKPTLLGVMNHLRGEEERRGEGGGGGERRWSERE